MELESPSILDASDPLSRAVNEISRTGLPVLIVKNGTYFGMIDERAIRQSAQHPDREKCVTLAERTPVLFPNSTVLDACNAFFAGRFKAIPVIEKGKIAGAITRHTLLSELLKEKMLSKKRVSEVMTSPVAAIDASATVGKARSELRRHNIRRLVVTKEGKISGILSVFDLAGRLASPRQSDAFHRGGEKTGMDSQPITSYVKKQVETVSETDPLSAAVRRMLEQRVAALIVEEGGYPVGIVTAKDILHAALAEETGSRVLVSGLPYGQREFSGELVSEGEKLLGKLGHGFEAATLAFHVKAEGSGFSIRARLSAAKNYSASASDFRLENALHRVLAELRRMAGRGKLEKVEKRKKASKVSDDE